MVLGGYPIPVGSVVVASQYVTHRDARFFSDPERFDPDRWEPARTAAVPKYAYFPFGGGPRTCIGESLARLELPLVIATLAEHWEVRPVPGYVAKPQPHVTLRPKGGMPLL